MSSHELKDRRLVVYPPNMFIEKNGRNFAFGQPTIKGWSTVSPPRLIALTGT